MRAPSVLVTGTAAGFGPELAVTLAGHGFRVYAGVKDLAGQPHLTALAERCKVTLRILHLDVTDPGSIAQAVDSVVAESGGIYGLVSTERVFARGFFEDWGDEEIRHVFATNVFGTMAVTRAVLPHMRAAGRGRIVIITSVAGRIATMTGSVYSASMFAEEGFAEALRQEVEPLGVRVSVVEQGLTYSAAWGGTLSVAARAQDPHGPYYTQFERASALFDAAMQSSPVTASDVAAAACRSLTDRQPRHRYVVGRRTQLVLGLQRYIPTQVFDRFFSAYVRRRLMRATRRSDAR